MSQSTFTFPEKSASAAATLKRIRKIKATNPQIEFGFCTAVAEAHRLQVWLNVYSAFSR